MTALITLPATPDVFTAYQEKLIHRELSPAEKDVTAEWLKVFNDVRAGELAGTVALERIGFLISQTDDPVLLRFLNAARQWILVAWGGGAV